jgi:hypothetical protein
MAFDIYTQGITYVADDTGKNISMNVTQPSKHMSVYLDAFDFIWDKMQSNDDFPLLKKVFSDPYGDEGEIYLDQLQQAAFEVQKFKNQFEIGCV